MFKQFSQFNQVIHILLKRLFYSVVNYINVHVSYSECMKLVFFIAFFYQ